jgi:flagellar hook assembly protein FlgD
MSCVRFASLLLLATAWPALADTTVPAQTITTNTTWTLAGSPYIVTGIVFVQGSATPVLTIEPGVTVQFTASGALNMNYTAPGVLQAVGTPAAPILFTSTGGTAPSSWIALYIGGYGATASQISYATVQYGGSTTYARGGLQIAGTSSVIDHVTFRGNNVAGMNVTGGSPQITNCTFDGNSGYGIDVAGGSPTISGCTFTNNSNYAIGCDGSLQLNGMDGLSATGNGNGVKNATFLRPNTVTANRTWHTSTLPYVVNGYLFVQSASAPILTIEPGVTVRFDAGGALVFNYQNVSSLQANGSRSAPILFTSNGTQTAGYWESIYIGGYSASVQSSMSYATVEYGGIPSKARGGLHVAGGAPVFDHLTLRHNLVAGLSGEGGTPTISNSAFSDNPAGVTTTGAATVTARRNYWNAASGPSGSGFGTGLSVSAATTFEPWLMGSPTTPEYFSSSTATNRTFDAVLPSTSRLSFDMPVAATWSATVYDAGHTALRTFTGSGLNGSFTWDGTNDAGVLQPDGTYTYEVGATSSANDVAAAMNGRIIADSSKAFTIAASETPSYFSPNGDGIQDAAVVSGTATYDDATWTFTVRDVSGTAIRTAGAVGPAVSFSWDGKNDAGVLQPDGNYTFDIVAALGALMRSASASATLDNTPPVAAITAPALTLSDAYENGIIDFPVVGTASDTNLTSWTLDYGSGTSPASWTVLQTSSAPVSNATLGTWGTLPLANGTYTLRLRVTDRAGTTTTATRQPNLANFKVTQPDYQINAAGGGTLTYTSTVPFALNETLILKNEAGQVVRTLFNGSRNSGNYSDAWNGRNDAGMLLPDGAYFVSAIVTAGASTATFDISNKYLAGWDYYYPTLSSTFDPYNHQPLSIQYQFNQPGRVIVVFTNKAEAVPCGPDDYCWKYNWYQPSGSNTLYWNGVDDTGHFRPDLNRVSVTSFRSNFPQNAVVLFGSKATMTNLSASPVVFGPAGGTQTISFDLATYQSQAANVEVTFLNVGSNSILRTITLSNQPAGHLTLNWDGKADNGMWVAAGDYAVTATATDPLGNKVSAQIPVIVKY